jgi:hypothetical protein
VCAGPEGLGLLVVRALECSRLLKCPLGLLVPLLSQGTGLADPSEFQRGGNSRGVFPALSWRRFPSQGLPPRNWSPQIGWSGLAKVPTFPKAVCSGVSKEAAMIENSSSSSLLLASLCSCLR